MLENTFTSLAAWFLEFLLSLGVPQFLADILLLAAKWGLIITLVTLDVIILIWLERKVSGFIQERPGPNRLGPAGLFQTIADTLKLMTKEDIIPGHVDRIVFMIAPLLFIIVAVMLYTVLPFGFDMAVVDMDMGLLFFLAVSSLSTICIFMAGWGSNNKWSLLGAMRSVAQMISYELPLVFSVLAIIMLTGSLRLYDVVAAQQNIWFVFLQPIAFVVYIVAATQIGRATPALISVSFEIFAHAVDQGHERRNQHFRSNRRQHGLLLLSARCHRRHAVHLHEQRRP